MNTYDGRIAPAEVFRTELAKEGRPSDYRSSIVPIDPANLNHAQRRQLAKTGETSVSRNSKCPCGSGKRFRKCHMRAR